MKKQTIGLGIGITALSIILGIFSFSYFDELETRNQKFSDNGDFIFEKESYSNVKYNSINGIVSGFERLLPNFLNNNFNLPYDVYIKFKNCNSPTTTYSPDKKEVTYCYEMLEFSFDLVDEATNSTSLSHIDKGEMVTGITFFFLYHELAHALIDVYDLPVLGKEEDAADLFATLIILNILEDIGPSYGFAGTLTLFDERSEIYTYTSDLKFWDPHSLDEQRLYSILCLIYEKAGSGAFPEGFIGSKLHERLQSCGLSYEKITKSWALSIEPYLKPDSTFLNEFG